MSTTLGDQMEIGVYEGWFKNAGKMFLLAAVLLLLTGGLVGAGITWLVLMP